MTKQCSHCGEMKPIEEFALASRAKDGRQWDCRACRKRYYKAGQQFEYQLESRYGITLAERNAMVAEQDGRCFGCHRVEAECRNGRLYVDHCHESGEVRKMLCSVCNLALGMLKDNPSTLRRLADMVEGVSA